jgi:uncharacterized membrane protein (DUF2068 family)
VSSVRNPKLRNRWLELIAAYKLLQATLLMAAGFGALKLVHKDVADVLMELVHTLHRDPEGRFIRFLLEKADLVDDHILRRFSLFVFVYAGLGILEGVGLLLEKAWAEYLTAIITASFLPLEIIEISHGVTWIKVGFLVVNLAVLVYLVFHLIRRRMVAGRLAESSR